MPIPKDFEDMWRELKAELQRMRDFMRNPFANSGITQDAPGEFTVDGSMTVTGDFNAQGKISNDALVNPVLPQSVFANATGFTLTTTLDVKVSVDVQVPVGYTRLAALATGSVYAINPNTTGGSNGQGGDAISARTDIGPYYSAWMPEGVSGANGFSTQTSSLSTLIEDLTPGDTVTLAERGMSNYQTMAADPSNRAYINAMLFWLR